MKIFVFPRARLGSFARAHGPPGRNWGGDGSRKPGRVEAPPPGLHARGFRRRTPLSSERRAAPRRAAAAAAQRFRIGPGKRGCFRGKLTNAARGTLWIFLLGAIFRVIFCGSPGDFPGFSCDFRDFPRVCRGGNPRIANGFQRIPEDFGGFQRNFNGFQRISEDFGGFQRNFNGFQRISEDFGEKPGGGMVFSPMVGRIRFWDKVTK